MHPSPKPRLDLRELRLQSVASGLPLELEVSSTRFAADEGEAQDSEGLRFAEPASFTVGRRMTTKLDQAGFVRMERQRELLEALMHRVVKTTSVALMLETGHQGRIARTLFSSRSTRFGGMGRHARRTRS